MSNLGNKHIFAKNLKYYIEKSGKDRNEICKDLNLKYSTFSEWVNANKYPRIDKIELIANYFNIQKADLIEEHKTENKKNGVMVPVLGKVVAGIPLDAVEEILDYEEISKDMAKQGEHFALQIKGNSMEPKFSEGDVVIVRKQPDVDTGDIAVVLVNGNEATVKKIKKRHDGVMLVPTNPEYEVMFYNNAEIQSLPVTILGKVVELRAKF